MKLVENVLLFGTLIYAILKLWQHFEVVLYGAVQARDVDTIVTILWIAVVIIAYLKGKDDGKSH